MKREKKRRKDRRLDEMRWDEKKKEKKWKEGMRWEGKGRKESRMERDKMKLQCDSNRMIESRLDRTDLFRKEQKGIKRNK